MNYFFAVRRVFNFFIKRDFRREALFFLMMPFCAALSSALIALTVAFSASSTLPSTMTLFAFLT